MTIYWQNEVKEVEEDIRDDSIEVRDVPHLQELHLDKNQKELPQKMSLTRKEVLQPLKPTETSQWSINNEANSGSLF